MMSKILIKEIDNYQMEVKEITFIYNGRKFVYKFQESPSFNESFIVDLNSDNTKLSENELENLKNRIEEIFENSEIQAGDQITIEKSS